MRKSTTRIAVAATALNFLLLVTALVQGHTATTQSAAPVLRGRALELVDDRGQIRARLNVEEDGEVVFRLLDDRGTIRVKLGAWRGRLGAVAGQRRDGARRSPPCEGLREQRPGGQQGWEGVAHRSLSRRTAETVGARA